MAKLIPSFMDERTPPGERDVFNLLAGGPDSWVALHSLDLAPWNRGLRTEIDFVVIAPDVGILCLEVKSHANIGFDGYRWYPETVARSPFKQAADGRHTFYRRLAELAPQFKRVPVVHCCIFPRARFDLQPNLSVQPWELMDARVFNSFTTAEQFCSDLKMRIVQSVGADSHLGQMEHALSRDQVDNIVKFCVPVQKRRPEARAEIEHREKEVREKLREQQKPVLRLADLNRRLVVSGGAGTGKTLIAMEVARRAAEAGRRVAFVCFNMLVGEWVRDQMAQVQPALPNLVVGRAIRILAEMTGVQIPLMPTQQFWDVDLPSEVEARMTDPEFVAIARFDYLVIDEAQDILSRPWIWGCLGQLLVGGTGTGALALFGDFENQVLADRVAMEESLIELDRANRPVHWDLSENCRNYRIIGDTAVRLAGIDQSIYAGYLRAGGSVNNYDIHFYDDDRAQLEKLGRWLREFKAQGYKSSEITILSFVADPLSAAVRLARTGFKLRPVRQPGESTAYTSVHAFKGMENEAVILTDVTLKDGQFHRSLFYTGMTRAKESVRILCESGSRRTLLNWLAGETSS